MVKREPEWTDEDRAELLALAVYEAGICQCGFHESLTSDRSNFFQPEYRTCLVCAGVDRYGRVQAAADVEAAKLRGDKAPAATPHPEDGRRLYVRRLSEAEVAERRSRRGPSVPAPIRSGR